LLPPYSSAEQRAALEERADFRQREFWIWSRADTHRYFIAGGGNDGEFELLWKLAASGADAMDKSIADRTFAHSGASILYLVAGRKPDARAGGLKK
jgi:hypothetical protein